MTGNDRALWPERAAPWCLGALFVSLSAVAAVVGYRLHTATEIEAMQAVLAEDRAVCARLGAPAGSDQFVRCAVELAWVRDQERRRIAARTESLP